jgi:hypothetical protein
MHTGLEDKVRDFPRLAAYFAERASGGVGLMVTGGFAPNVEGWLTPFGSRMASSGAARSHKILTDSVHHAGGKIALQILHAGRYGYSPFSVAPSRIKSPITPFTPRALSDGGIERQIKCFVRAGKLARDAGYDGVEVMGSEGYFINQFLSVGVAPTKIACACRSKLSRACEKRWVKISSSSIACRCSISYQKDSRGMKWSCSPRVSRKQARPSSTRGLVGMNHGCRRLQRQFHAARLRGSQKK